MWNLVFHHVRHHAVSHLLSKEAFHQELWRAVPRFVFRGLLCLCCTVYICLYAYPHSVFLLVNSYAAKNVASHQSTQPAKRTRSLELTLAMASPKTT